MLLHLSLQALAEFQNSGSALVSRKSEPGFLPCFDHDGPNCLLDRSLQVTTFPCAGPPTQAPLAAMCFHMSSCAAVASDQARMTTEVAKEGQKSRQNLQSAVLVSDV